LVLGVVRRRPAPLAGLVAIVDLMSAMSSATAAKPRSIFTSRSAKPRSTVERMVSSDALRFLVGFFAAICGEHIMAIGPAHASSTRMESGIEYAKWTATGRPRSWATDLQTVTGAKMGTPAGDGFAKSAGCSDAGLSRGWRLGSRASRGAGLSYGCGIGSWARRTVGRGALLAALLLACSPLFLVRPAPAGVHSGARRGNGVALRRKGAATGQRPRPPIPPRVSSQGPTGTSRGAASRWALSLAADCAKGIGPGVSNAHARISLAN
jgi:hypothetical protein